MQTKLRIAMVLISLFFFNLINAQTSNWTNIGPVQRFSAVPNGKELIGIGRCTQIKFHPTDPNIMYAVSPNGGLYKSVNKGVKWSVLGTDQISKIQSASIAIDPTDDQVMYWGTGDPNHYSDGLGVYKTTDGGVTWKLSNIGMGNRLVLEMIFLPTDHKTIIAATNNGIYKSTDAGANWVLNSASSDFQDICFAPGSNGKIIYAVTSNAFYRSADAGNTWIKITSPAFIFGGSGTRVAASVANPNIVYVSNIGSLNVTEVYKSTDAGMTFADVRMEHTKRLTSFMGPDDIYGQGNYNFDIEVNPKDSNELYICAHLIWRSKDGGANWNQQQIGYGKGVHTDQHDIKFDPYVNGQIWNANDGGIWSNTNNGTGEWTRKFDGFAATEVYHGAINKSNKRMSYVGTQDNAGIYSNSGTWYSEGGGDFFANMWFDYSGNFYSDSEQRRISFSSASYSYSSLNLPVTPSGAKFAFTAANVNIAYFSNAGIVYRCSNLTSATPLWTKIYTVPSGDIKDLQVDAANPDRVYVFTNAPALYRSDNATASADFIKVTLPTPLNYASIAPIPNSNVIYVAQGSAIYRSADKGMTWAATSGFPSARVMKVVADYKSTIEAVYACYKFGVYYKDNTKTSWVNYAAGLPIITDITDMDIYNDGISKGVLDVYYYGRGAWQTDLVSVPSNIKVAITSPANNLTFDKTAAINLTATATSSSANISKVEFYNGITLLATKNSAPYTYSWTGMLPGVYDVTAVAYDDLGTKASSSSLTVTVDFNCRPVTGTPFGTSAYAVGSEYDKAFDGNDATFFDASSGSDGYTGLDLGTPQIVQGIEYLSRPESAGRMKGGKFQGSNISSSAGFVDLYTIPQEPTYDLQQISIANFTAYRYYRYLSPAGGYCNVAEIKFCAVNNQVPTISITAPSHNTLYPSVPAAVNLTANAADADGTINKVEFYQGTTLLGTDYSSPYSFNWTGVAAGTYQLSAKAYDNLGASAASFSNTIIVGNQNPTVAIVSPGDGDTFDSPASITIYATASDPDGTISKVEFYNGATLLGTAFSSPYNYNWTIVPIGSYKLTAKAYDNSGNVSTSSSTTVNVLSCSTLSGTPFGTSPPWGPGREYDKVFDGNIETFFDSLSGSPNYTGLDFGKVKNIKAIRFYPRDGYVDRMIGGKFQGSNVADFSSGIVDMYTITSLPSLGWNEVTVPNGANFRYVRYYTPANGYCNVNEIEFCGIDNVFPVVNITSPSNGASYNDTQTINIVASASDTDGSISRVEFYRGGQLLGTSITSPYTYAWTNAAAGTYVITAKAYDNNNAATTSSAITVVVNASPSVNITSPLNNSVYTAPASITFNATAADPDGTINKVEFYKGVQLLGISSTSPYNYTWTNAAAGSYVITAKAYDNNNAVTTSSAITVVVNASPSVSITAPLNYSVFTAPASITFNATAADTDGTISKVEFYKGGLLLGTSSTSPYSYTWTNAAAGSYVITAKAYDNNNAVTTSFAITVVVNASPSVSITAPANNSVYTAPASITFNASASDSDGTITKVEFYKGGQLLAISTASPYSYTWTNASVGSYVITAKAYDDKGAITTSAAITIVVNTPMNQSPLVSIALPVDNAVFIAPADININASASDSDGTITKVEFYSGTKLLGTSTTNPYTLVWINVAAGSYVITAKAYDNNNATAASTVINLVVKNNNPPTVNINTPADNSTFVAPASIEVSASAADSDGTISKVEYYNGTKLLGTSTTSPYTFTWLNTAAGSYVITARAYDNINAVTTSALVNLLVKDNQAPFVAIISPADNTIFTAPASLTINASATDSDGTISKVEFYNGETLLSIDNISPYACELAQLKAGTYQITVKATDNTGNMTTSLPKVIVVKESPVVTMTSPEISTEEVKAGSNILFNFSVNDKDSMLKSIIISDNGVMVGTITQAPYSFTLADITAGDHQFTISSVLENGIAFIVSRLQIKSIDSTLGIGNNELQQSSKCILYPNPCETHFNIKLFGYEGKNLSYRIIDLNGRDIVEKNIGTIRDKVFEQEVKVQGLASATYLVYIQVDEIVFVKKIIVAAKPLMYKRKK